MRGGVKKRASGPRVSEAGSVPPPPSLFFLISDIFDDVSRDLRHINACLYDLGNSQEGRSDQNMSLQK